MSLKHVHTKYPRFFVRLGEDGVEKIAKAETADEAALYPADAGWREYGLTVSGGGASVTSGGHTMGVSVEGDAQ